MTIVFRKKDFEQLEFKLVFVNLTSGTECKTHNLVRLDEINEDSMSVRIPKNSCQSGHSLMFLFYEGQVKEMPQYIPKDGKGKDVYFAVTGKVKTKENDIHFQDFDIIEFNFTQFEKELWSQIYNLYQEKQLEILTLMDSIKSNE